MKGATEFSYAQGGGTVDYGCLAGRYMTVYVDQYGHLGPQTFSGGIPGARAAGVADSDTGYPEDNITTNGQITPTASPPTYAILRSLSDRSIEDSTVVAIKGMRELIALATGGMCGTWGVKSAHTDLQSGGGANGVVGVDATPLSLTVSGATSTDPLEAEATIQFVDSTLLDPLLNVTLNYSFQNDASALEMVRVKVVATLEALQPGVTGTTFGFGIDPNPGITTGTTFNHFLSVSDPEAFAVEGASGDWNVGLAVYEEEGEGAILGYTNQITEGILQKTFDTQIAGNDNIRLGSGTNADLYSGNTLVDSTTNWKTDVAWQSGLPDITAAYALFVRSPEYDLEVGEPQAFTFYILTRLIEVVETASARVWAYAS
jgi:hypothetical protein